MRHRFNFITSYLSSFIPLGVIVYALYWRITIGMNRFFDVDEFTHMNWAASVARGEKLYVDFMTFFGPVFYWIFGLLFMTFGNSSTVFIAARLMALGVFAIVALLLGAVFIKTRGLRYALIAIAVFVWLPMPFDKLIEVRPDNLALLFSLLGSWYMLQGLYSDAKKQIHPWFWTGICFAIAMTIITKMVPFVVVGTLVFFLLPETKSDIVKFFRGKLSRKAVFQSPLSYMVGALVVLVLFLLWTLTLGDPITALYSLTLLPLEANKVTKFTVMEPHLFFFPNSSFYGSPVINMAIIANHSVWVIGIIVGITRLFTPFITAEGNTKKALGEILLAGTFLLFCFLYVGFYPLKHTQYLIPIAVFVAYYAADFLAVVFGKVEKVGMGIIPIMVLFILTGIGWKTLYQVNNIKLSWNNMQQMIDIERLLYAIPLKDTVFDIEGRTVFWKPGYFICCLPFGEYLHHISRQPEKLHKVLEENKVPWVYQGTSNRLWSLSVEDVWYIRTYYEPVEGWGETLWKRK